MRPTVPFRRLLAGASALALLTACRADEPTGLPIAPFAMQGVSDVEVTATWLGTLPVNGRIIRANAINDRGEIVGQGYRGLPNVRYLAVRWTEADLARPIAATETYFGSEAVDVNDRGETIGWFSVGPGAPSHGFFLPRRDALLVLDQGPTAALVALNRRGVAAGTSDQALTWSADDGLTWLPGRRANDINDRGDVAGVVGYGRAGVFLADGSVIEIPASTIEESEATAINNHGAVAGIVGSRSYGRAFTWTARGGVRLLSTPDGWFSVAEAINDGSDVAGWISQGGSTGPTIAVLWTASGRMVRLGPMPGSPGTGPGGSSKALDLNNRGEVVGYIDEWRPGGTDGYRWTVLPR